MNYSEIFLDWNNKNNNNNNNDDDDFDNAAEKLIALKFTVAMH
jgi:hypothetical protein